jgi:hypothetical protein
MSADLAENDIRAKGKWHSRVAATQRSSFALIGGERPARDEDSAPRQGNPTANRAGDKRSTPPPPLQPLAYRVNDAIKVSGLSRSSIYKLIGEEKLRSVLVAGRRPDRMTPETVLATPGVMRQMASRMLQCLAACTVLRSQTTTPHKTLQRCRRSIGARP